MSELRISEELALPLDMITQTAAILAKRRVGKTYTASVMAEEMAKANLPFVVLDPTGAWWGLRASADGTAPGFPVIIIGGAHGDLPLEPGSGKLIADLVVENPGFYVIDLSGTTSNAEQDRFATDFAERLYRRKAEKKDPLHLFVDEADAFIPQRPMPGQQRMLGAFEALVRRGGIRGIGMTVITQRPAVINKNVLTQIECLIVLQITGPQDRAAIDEWVKGNGTPEQREQLIGSLASLGRGQAWFWSPAWLETFRCVSIRLRETFNSSATPQVGDQRTEPRMLAAVDLDAIREQLAETMEQAEAEDPERLRRRIAALEEQLRDRPAAEPEIREVEVRVIPRPVVTYLQQLAKFGDELHQLLLTAPQVLEHCGAADEGLPVRETQPELPPRAVPMRSITAAPPQRVKINAAAGGTVSTPQQRILDALATFEALGLQQVAKSNVAVFSGASAKSSGYSNNLGTLRSRGLIDYPSGGYVSLTEAGRAAARSQPAIASVADLHEAWYRQLPNPQAAIVRALVRIYPDAVSKVALAAVVGQSPTSSGFSNNLGALRSLGLIDYPQKGCAAATELLFPQGKR